MTKHPDSNVGTFENVGCPFCGSRTASTLFAARDRAYNTEGSFTVERCTDCTGLYTQPRPAPETLAKYYPTEYGPHQNRSEIATTSGHGVRRLLGKLFHAYMGSHDVVSLPLRPGDRLLELGCATGSYMMVEQHRGIKVTGVEFADAPADFARRERGLHVITGTLEDAAFEEGTFHGVVGWMVLEHVPEIRATIREIHRILKPGGYLAFSVPNAESWQFRVFREDWYSLEVPRHLSFMGPTFIRSFLAAEGFVVDRVYQQHTLDDVIASLGYFLEARGWKGRWIEWLRDFPNRTTGFERFAIRPILQPLAWVQSLFGGSGRITVVAHRLG